MPDYKNGKIYKITSGNQIYIGSTTQCLSQRLGGHRAHAKAGRGGAIENLVFNPDCQITLIESYPCNSRDELLARERYYVDKYPSCVNILTPLLTDEERKKKYPWVQAEREINKKFDEIFKLTGKYTPYKERLPLIEALARDYILSNQKAE